MTQRMPIALHHLPDDIDALKFLVADQLARNEQRTIQKQRSNAQVLALIERLNLALTHRYAPAMTPLR